MSSGSPEEYELQPWVPRVGPGTEQPQISADPRRDSSASSSSGESMVTAEEYLGDDQEASTRRGEDDQLEVEEQLSQGAATGHVSKRRQITTDYLAQKKETARERHLETSSSEAEISIAAAPRLQLDIRPRTSVHTPWLRLASHAEPGSAGETILRQSIRPRTSTATPRETRSEEEQPSTAAPRLQLDVCPRATVNTPWTSHASPEEELSATARTLRVSIRPRVTVDTPRMRPAGQEEERSAAVSRLQLGVRPRATVHTLWERHTRQDEQSSAAREFSTLAAQLRAAVDEGQESQSDPIARPIAPCQFKGPAGPGWGAQRSRETASQSCQEEHRGPIARPQSSQPAEGTVENRGRWGASQADHQAIRRPAGRRGWRAISPPRDTEDAGHPPGWVVAHPTAVNKPVLSRPSQPQRTHESAQSTQLQPTLDTPLITQLQHIFLDSPPSTQTQPTLITAQITQTTQPQSSVDTSQTQHQTTLITAQITQTQPTLEGAGGTEPQPALNTARSTQAPTLDCPHTTQSHLSSDNTRPERPNLTLNSVLASRHQRLVRPPGAPPEESPVQDDESSSESDVDAGVTLAPQTHKSHDHTPKEYRSRSLNMNYIDEQLSEVLAEGHGSRHRGPPQEPQRGLFLGPYKPRTATPREDDDTTPLHPMVARRMRYRYRPGPHCIHEAVIRNFPEATGERCGECRQTHRFHWMCVADTEEFAARDKSAQRKADISILNPWIIKAIEESHYTDEQIDKLIEQKLDVLTTAARDRAADSSPLQDSSSSTDLTRLEEMVKGKTPTQEALHAVREKRLEEEKYLERTAPCQAQVCSNCHQGWVDRAWESIDRIVNEPYKPLPNIPEYLNRPVSDAAVLRNAHWEDVSELREWWRYVTQESEIDLSPILDVTNRGGFTQEQTMQLVEWVRDDRSTQPRFSNFLSWVESGEFTPSQREHLISMLRHSRQVWSRSRDLTLVDYLTRQGERFTFVVYEETEVRGQMVETLGFEFLLEDTMPGATSGFARFLLARHQRVERHRARLHWMLAQQESGARCGGSGSGSS